MGHNGGVSVETLNVRFPKRQVVGTLIIGFHEHQQCNVNLQNKSDPARRPPI